MEKEAIIEIKVILDEKKIPNKIIWKAEDQNIINKETNAILISIWDQKNNETLNLNLWTKKMLINDMKLFFYQLFICLSKTYEKATGEKEISLLINNFAENFYKATKIKK